MMVRDVLTTAIKRDRTGHTFLNRLDVQSLDSEAGVWLLLWIISHIWA